ncbi:hypothetical protein D3C78_880290 [compost metagenome]
MPVVNVRPGLKQFQVVSQSQRKKVSRQRQVNRLMADVSLEQSLCPGDLPGEVKDSVLWVGKAENFLYQYPAVGQGLNYRGIKLIEAHQRQAGGTA